MNNHFATSSFSRMRPLAYQGIFITGCYLQLKSFLNQNQGFLTSAGMPRASSLLAEPMQDDKTGLIDWYTEANTPPVPLASLSEEEQQAVKARIAVYATALQRLIDSEAGQKDPQIVEVLKKAMQHPSAQDVYVADGLPVLINWGFAPGSLEAKPEDIMALGSKRPQPEPVPQAPAIQEAPQTQTEPQASAMEAAEQTPAVPVIVRHTYGCLPWLLPLLLLILIWLLLTWSGYLPSFLPQDLFRQTTAMSGEENRAQKLQTEAEELYAKLDQHNALCIPQKKEKPAAPSEPEPVKPEEPANETKGPAADSSAEKPEETKPLAEAEVPFFGGSTGIPEEATPSRPARKGESMEIPEEAREKKDLTFLEGCWVSETGMVRARDDSPIMIEYCFNKKGKGSIRVHEVGDTGQICKGKASVRFNGKKLHMRGGTVYCPNGSGYVESSVICTGIGDSTQCHGVTGYNSWDAKFYRQ